jgi:hypothetical protein
MSWKNFLNVAEATGGSASLTELADRFAGIKRVLRGCRRRMLANGPVCNQPGIMRGRRNRRALRRFNRTAKSGLIKCGGASAPHPRKRIAS